MTTHERDESIPEVFMRHVGNVLRCTCGAAYVAGFFCPAMRGTECPHGFPCETSADCLARS